MMFMYYYITVYIFSVLDVNNAKTVLLYKIIKSKIA